ncbi:MAG: CDP-2,3-bis-(O-geranylgeranyl)-sn-glycerol synthase [Archaeoglobaceae archaeon]|nr:CDP-2,3-bis-(O-geranylgeranyl)-sn-glycerol synthase [Archaeoglobaceae archaeon]MDW7989574.1 CDP-2,3-bis-(O-geranylgeranyl)-sn-glycerol synthase [Archaeoglobaceae archaeon]
MLEIVLKVIWLLLPAYTPNNFAVICGGIKPMDFGKNFFDGRRVFGDGKTFSGFFGGILGGIMTANIQRVLEKILGISLFFSLNYFEFLVFILTLTFGAMIGDLFGSFIKRRLNIDRGKSFPILDQLMFLVVAIIISSFTTAFWKLFTLLEILIALLITPLLHLSVNVLAFKLRLKEVPW